MSSLGCCCLQLPPYRPISIRAPHAFHAFHDKQPAAALVEEQVRPVPPIQGTNQSSAELACLCCPPERVVLFTRRGGGRLWLHGGFGVRLACRAPPSLWHRLSLHCARDFPGRYSVEFEPGPAFRASSAFHCTLWRSTRTWEGFPPNHARCPCPQYGGLLLERWGSLPCTGYD